MARMKVRRRRGTITLSQKPRLWFRAAASFWAAVVVMTPFMVYSDLFSSTTTVFTCDRGTGVCAVDGRTKDIPRLADIARAEMDHSFNRRDGTNWGINLVTRDGRKYAIEEQRGVDDRVVADYRAAVKSINAYVADPVRKRLDAAFTYRTSLWQKIQSVVYLLFGVMTLLMVGAVWKKTAYVFELDRVTLVTKWWFQRSREQIAAARIVGIVDRPASDGRVVDLKLDDAGRITIAQGSHERAAALSDLAKELADFFVKPLERASA